MIDICVVLLRYTTLLAAHLADPCMARLSFCRSFHGLPCLFLVTNVALLIGMRALLDAALCTRVKQKTKNPTNFLNTAHASHPSPGTRVTGGSPVCARPPSSQFHDLFTARRNSTPNGASRDGKTLDTKPNHLPGSCACAVSNGTLHNEAVLLISLAFGAHGAVQQGRPTHRHAHQSC